MLGKKTGSYMLSFAINGCRLLIGNKLCAHHLTRGYFLIVAHCYMTIQRDKTISRLHANLITEEAKAPKSEINDVADIPRMTLRVHDLSKFGTFVNKQPGSKPLTSAPGCEAALNDGDVVTFGTKKTSFRYLF
jgi:hypothetical protein